VREKSNVTNPPEDHSLSPFTYVLEVSLSVSYDEIILDVDERGVHARVLDEFLDERGGMSNSHFQRRNRTLAHRRYQVRHANAGCVGGGRYLKLRC
jgi:hypothetical protein